MTADGGVHHRWVVLNNTWLYTGVAGDPQAVSQHQQDNIPAYDHVGFGADGGARWQVERVKVPGMLKLTDWSMQLDQYRFVDAVTATCTPGTIDARLADWVLDVNETDSGSRQWTAVEEDEHPVNASWPVNALSCVTTAYCPLPDTIPGLNKTEVHVAALADARGNPFTLTNATTVDSQLLLHCREQGS